MGRKSLGKTRVNITFYPHTLEDIDAAAKQVDETRSDFVEGAAAARAKRILSTAGKPQAADNQQAGSSTRPTQNSTASSTTPSRSADAGAARPAGRTSTSSTSSTSTPSSSTRAKPVGRTADKTPTSTAEAEAVAPDAGRPTSSTSSTRRRRRGGGANTGRG